MTLCMLWTVEKALSRHDQLRNLEAKMLSEVCQDIKIEPQLQPLTGENMSLQSANTEDSASLDVKARGFYIYVYIDKANVYVLIFELPM